MKLQILIAIAFIINVIQAESQENKKQTPQKKDFYETSEGGEYEYYDYEYSKFMYPILFLHRFWCSFLFGKLDIFSIFSFRKLEN